MKKPPIRTLVFDVNGTLADDTKTVFIPTLNDILVSFGRKALPARVIRQRFGQPWTNFFREEGVDENTVAERLPEKWASSTGTPQERYGRILYDLYNERYQSYPMPELFPKEKGVLEILVERRATLHIVSAQEYFMTARFLREHGLANFFTGIYGGISDKAKKISELAGNHAGDRLAYIGDQAGDVEAAKKAGVVAVALLLPGSIHSRERLREANPDFLMQSWQSLLRLVPQYQYRSR